MNERAITYQWEGGVLRPLTVFADRAAKQFEEGATYQLEVVEERSKEAHNHYFGLIGEAFNTLPEMYGDRFSSAEHLRKWCLIKRGFRNEHPVIATSPEQAASIAALCSTLDDCAVIQVHGNVVMVYTAKTQKMKRGHKDGMDKHEFYASKQAVLEECAAMLGVDVNEWAKPKTPVGKELEVA